MEIRGYKEASLEVRMVARKLFNSLRDWYIIEVYDDPHGSRRVLWKCRYTHQHVYSAFYIVHNDINETATSIISGLTNYLQSEQYNRSAQRGF
jgi:hypothetical protein